VVFGLTSPAFDLLTVAMPPLVFRSGETLFRTSWLMIALLTGLVVALVRRTRHPCSPSFGSTIAVGVATLTMPLIGPTSAPFGFTPLQGGRAPVGGVADG
jgi:hypothetical protein